MKILKYSSLSINKLNQDILTILSKNKLNEFNDIQNELFRLNIFYSNCLSKSIEEYNYTVQDIIFDINELNLIWYKKNLNKKVDKINLNQLFLDQVEFYKPNIIFFQNKSFVDNSLLKNLKKNNKHLKLIIIHNGFMLQEKDLSSIDIILAAFPKYQKIYSKFVDKSYLFYHYFNSNILREINQIDKKYDITFIGSSGYNLPAHYNRLIFLTKLFEKTNIFGWLEEEQFKIQNPLKRKLHNFLRENFIYLPEFILKKLSFHKIFDEILYEKKILNNLNLNSIPQKIKNQFKERVEQSTWGLSMYESIASSYCSLNIHMAKSNESGNMRLFEITGMGTCCLTEKHSNTDELFNESEIIQYKNIDDCIEKIHFINNNKELASEIAKRGQKKTLLKHSQKSRAKQLNEIIKENI